MAFGLFMKLKYVVYHHAGNWKLLPVLLGNVRESNVYNFCELTSQGLLITSTVISFTCLQC